MSDVRWMRRWLAVVLVLAVAVAPAAMAPAVVAAQEAPPAPPPDSGAGRRVVYSLSQQRVWQVAVAPEGAETVERTYLVSGRRGYPKAGTYSVFSTSRHTRAGSLRMEYMVRFTKSRRTNVGFHSIPVDRRGRPIQSEAQLGTPRSRGCVRPSVADAAALWAFAPVGTTVVVTS